MSAALSPDHGFDCGVLSSLTASTAWSARPTRPDSSDRCTVGVGVGVGVCDVAAAVTAGPAAGDDPPEHAASAKTAATAASRAGPAARRRVPGPRTTVSGTAWI